MPDRLRPRARHRADHRAGGARSGAAQEARRGGGQGAEGLRKIPGGGPMPGRRSQPPAAAKNGVAGVRTRMHVSAANRRGAALPVRAMVRAGARRADATCTRSRKSCASSRARPTSGSTIRTRRWPRATRDRAGRRASTASATSAPARCASNRRWPRRCSRPPMTTSARPRGAGCPSAQESHGLMTSNTDTRARPA